MADDPILEWANDIYTPGERTADLEPDPNFDPDAEIDLPLTPLSYTSYGSYDSDPEPEYFESDERVQEWADEVPGDAGSGEDPFTFQGDPYMNEEMDRFLENQEMGPPRSYF